jgi:cell division protein ZapA
MSREPKLVQVEIFGQTYKLRADEDEAYVEQLAAYVDEKMREMARQTRAVDSLKVAILAALNIADEHRRALRSGQGAVPGEGERPTSVAEETASLERRLGEWERVLDEALAG